MTVQRCQFCGSVLEEYEVNECDMCAMEIEEDDR
jgi:hypothetical protein